MKRAKVFGIGFHKTGTSSLADALSILGYKVTGPNATRDANIAQSYKTLAQSLSQEFDAFQDNPWPLVYREMDAKWPGSKFILTTRDPEKWIISQVKHFGHRESPMRKLIYGDDRGCPAGNEDHYLKVYNAHNKAVRAYFQGRENDLLEIDLTKNAEWTNLCAFLGVHEPAVAFPHANSASRREQRLRRKEMSLRQRVAQTLASRFKG